MWDGLIIDIDHNIESVSKVVDDGVFKIKITFKNSFFPQYYGFGQNEEQRDAKYKEILSKLVK